MTKKTLPKKFVSYLPFIVYMAVLVFLMPRAAKFEYEYKSGSPWKYDSLVSEFDFPIYKTEEQLMRERVEAETNAVPYFRYSDNVTSRCVSQLSAASEALPDSLRPVLLAEVRRLTGQGVMPDDFAKADKRMALSESFIYIQKGKRALKYPVDEVYKLSAARISLREALKSAFPEAPVDSLMDASSIADRLEANLVFDRQLTALIHSEENRDISPTMGFVSAGTVIVSNGEIVTSEVAQMLDSYKKEYESNMGSDTPSPLIWLSNIILALILGMTLFWVIWFADASVFDRLGEICYIVFVSLLAAVVPMMLLHFDITDLVYLVPFTIFALYLQAFFPNRTIVPVYLVSLLPVALFMPQGVSLYALYVLAGMLAIKMFDSFNKGLKQFLTVVFFVLSLGYLAMSVSGMLGGMMLRDLTYILIASFLSVVLYQLVFLFEKVFSLLSVAKLDELTETSNSLLRSLELKAPGTFQHSLQVMSMADACARAIGADVHLVRAGAMYHDIGKMNNPLCFIENQSLTSSEDKSASYHSGLTPEQSAQDITRHVPDGMEIARKSKLPEKVSAFILTHHGDNCVRSFYNKYLHDGGDPSAEDLFRYSGKRPQTREQVILMLCDSMEAASRTLKDRTPKGYSDFVEAIVASKLSEQQLSEAEITIKELGTVKEVLKNYLAQLYHERTVYPKRKEKNGKK